MEILLPSVEVLERFRDELRAEVTRSRKLIEELWRYVTRLFNVGEEAKRVLPEIRAFYTIESLVDINFIVGGARSILPLTWDTSSLRPALVEFARPLVFVNSYVYYVQTLIAKRPPYLTLVLIHELSHIAFALGRSSCWHGLELELLYRASRNKRLIRELPCLWQYPLTATLSSEQVRFEALFEAPALWGEEILLEELGFEKNVIERRIKICSAIEKEVELMICGEQDRNLVEYTVREHVELVKKHWSNVRGRDHEDVYNYVANKLAKILGRDFMEEYIASVRGSKAIGCKIIYNPSKVLETGVIPRIKLFDWITLLHKYGKKFIVVN